MLEFEDKNNNRILTRYTNNKRYFDKVDSRASSAMFYGEKDKGKMEISVYDITEELNNNKIEEIYKIGDIKVYKNKNPRTKARADIRIEDVRKIKSVNNSNLKVYRTFSKSKHRNIKPIPIEEAAALNIASHLARVSVLHVRER